MPFLSARATALVVGVILLVGAGIVAQSPGPVKRKLGPEINGPRREIVPIVSPDGTTLFFSREGYEVDQTLVDQEIGPPPKPAAAQPPKPADPAVLEMLKKGGLSEAEIQKFKAMLEQGQKESAEAARNQPPPTGGVMGTMGQHAWMSKRRPDGSWGKAEYVPPPINKAFGASAVYAALPDNNTLLVGGRFDPSSEEIQNLFNPEAKKPAAKNTIAALTTRTATGWSTPVYLDIEGFDTTAPRNDFFLAPDGKVLLLSIENAQSLGKRDLYVSFAKAGKGWTRPKNLGAPINSPAHEGGPFIAPDGVTLYFTSNREGGLGEYDIYVTRRLDDTWLRWSAPENAGPGINTPQADTFLSVDASGTYAFMASGKLMEEDIYEFTLPAALKPKPVAFVRGRVKSPAGTAVAAGIAYERLRDGTGAGAANADPKEGRYQIALPLGEDYGFLAQASGYISVSEHVDLRAAKTNDVIERDLTLVPLKTREPIRLNNVFFRTNEAVLLPESARELNRLVQLLNDNPAMRIEVAGHTDALSDDIFNQKLSEARAAAVVAYLMNGGIAAARLQSRGFGESRPVADNTTEQGRALNRRVEFTIVQ